MKHILFILGFIITFGVSYSQPFTNRGSAAVTNVDQRLKAGLNFYLPVTTDTTLNGGLDSLGALLLVIKSGDTSLYMRIPRAGGNKWAKMLRSGDAAGGVLTFNTRTGNVTLSISDVTTALGYTPPNPNGTNLQYIAGDGSKVTFPTIPAQFNPIAGYGISITGTYPNKTFTADTSVLFPAVRATISGGGAGGISSLNGLTAATQTFATGTAGSDFGISSASTTHTFNLPIVSGTNTGKVTPTLFNAWNAKISNITGLVTAGTNVTVTGSGTSGSPYVINAPSGKNADSIKKLPVDTTTNRNNYVLTFDSTNHKWILAAPGSGGGGSGTVTQVNTGYGLSGGPVTTTGTLLLDSATLYLTALRRKDSTLYFPKYRGDTLSTNVYNALNGKQPQLNGTGFVKATGTTISYDNSTYITGNQTITFTPTGDVQGSASGTTSLTPALTIQANAVTTTKINNNAVTYAKIQPASGQSLLGATGAGNFQEISLGTNLSMTGSTLNASGGGGSSVTLVSDSGRLPLVNSVIPAIGLAAPNHTTNYDFNNLSPDYYKISTTPYFTGGKYGAWLTPNLTGDSVQVSVPFWVVIGDSQAEGNPGLNGRFHGSFNYNYPDTTGQISYQLRQFTNTRCFNNGIGGQTSSQVLARFMRDVVGVTDSSLNPVRTLSGKAYGVVIVVGINDIADDFPLAVPEQNLTQMAAICAQYNIQCVMLNMPGNTTSTVAQSKRIDSLNAWLASGALNGLNVAVVDYNHFWRDPTYDDNLHPNLTYIIDNVHPNKTGYDSLTALISRAAHLPKLNRIAITNEISPAGFGPGYARPTAFTINNTAYTSSVSSDTITVTNPIITDSAWIKITASTGSGNTGFSWISYLQTNTIPGTVYTRNFTPATNQNSAATYFGRQAFSAPITAIGGHAIGTIMNHALTTSASLDELVALDMSGVTYSNPGSFINTTNVSIKTSADLLVNGITVGNGRSQNAFNTTVGASSLANISTGYNNSGLGLNALHLTADGHDNTALGLNSLYSNISGNYNSAIGSTALYFNTGSNNNAVGYSALQNNTSGSFNTANGAFTLTGNVSGSFSVAVGYGVMQASGGSAHDNTGVGTQALTNVTGNYNSAIGGYALQNLANGNLNTAIGLASAYSQTAGSFNTTIGPYSNPVSLTGSNQFNAGNVIYASGLYGVESPSSVPTDSGRVGIGVTIPTARLHLRRGTDSVGTAPLKFTTTNSELLTIPEPGAVEVLADSLYWTGASGTRYKVYPQGSSSSDTLKLAFSGIGERPFYAHIDTLFGKTIKGLNSISIASGTDSTINVQLSNDTTGSITGYHYGFNAASRRGFYSDADSYVLNQTTQQPTSNFNITGKGKIGDTLWIKKCLIDSGDFRSPQSGSIYMASMNSYTTGNYQPIVWNNGTGRLEVIGALQKNQLAHTIFTPTTGGTVTSEVNTYNIINPAGALLALTVNLPSSPSNNDMVYVKFTQAVTTVTYANGTVVDGITSPIAGGLVILVFDSGTSSWY